MPDFLVLDPTTLITTPPPPHLIHNLLRETGSAILYGPTGVGKSRFLWQCACAWSAGHSAFGFTPREPLRILYVEADMDRHETQAFVHELAAAGCAPTANLRLVCYQRDLFLLAFRDARGTIRQAELTDWLHAATLAFDAHLVIYDALADLHDVDGNSQSDAHVVLRAAQRAAAYRAYIGVLTQRKLSLDNQRNGDNTIEDALGSQAWNRRANTTLHALGVPPATMRAVAIEKSRLAPTGPTGPLPQIWLEMQPSGLFAHRAPLDDRLVDLARALPHLSHRALAKEALRRLPADLACDGSTIRRHLQRLVATGVLPPTKENGEGGATPDFSRS